MTDSFGKNEKKLYEEFEMRGNSLKSHREVLRLLDVQFLNIKPKYYKLCTIHPQFCHTPLYQQGESMTEFRIEKPFEKKLPRRKDLINEHVMGDVWIRDLPFDAVTDPRKIAEHFIENSYLGELRGEKDNLEKSI